MEIKNEIGSNIKQFFKTQKNEVEKNLDNITKPKNSQYELTPEQEDILEKNLVWIFASPRSGTTWVAAELLSNYTHIMDEPYIGTHLAGPFNGIMGKDADSSYSRREKMVKQHRSRDDYFFSNRYKDSWKHFARKLILNRIYAQFQDLEKKIIIKEPN